MVNITIVWISGHQGIQFNDIADCLELWLQVQHVIFPQKVYPPLVLSHTMTWSKLQVILPYNHGKGNGIKIQDVSGFYIRSKFNFCSQKKIRKGFVSSMSGCWNIILLKRFCFIDVRMLEYHTVACYFMILCYVMIRTILVQPICLLVNVVLQEKQNTFYGVVLAFSKLKIS